MTSLLKKAGAIERTEIEGVTYLLRVPDDYLRDQIHGHITEEVGRLPSEADIHKRLKAGLKKVRLDRSEEPGLVGEVDRALGGLERWQDLREELQEPVQVLTGLIDDIKNCEDPEAEAALRTQLTDHEGEWRDRLDEFEVLTEEVESLSEQLQSQWPPYRFMLAQQARWLKLYDRESLRFLLVGSDGLTTSNGDQAGGDLLMDGEVMPRGEVERIPRSVKQTLMAKAHALLSLDEAATKN